MARFVKKEPIIRPADGGNPRSQAFKSLEMSVRRAYQLNSGLIDALSFYGNVEGIKKSRAWLCISNKDIRDALSVGDFGKEDAAVNHQEVWEWMIDHWYYGGLKRSVEATLVNLTDTNRKAIKEKVETLYG